MEWYWFTLFLLYLLLFIPAPHKDVWGGIHNTPLKIAWGVNMLVVITCIVLILIDDQVPDWIWICFIAFSILWIPTVFFQHASVIWIQRTILTFVALSVLSMLFYVHGWLYLAVIWVLFHAVFVDLVVWTRMRDSPYIPTVDTPKPTVDTPKPTIDTPKPTIDVPDTPTPDTPDTPELRLW